MFYTLIYLILTTIPTPACTLLIPSSVTCRDMVRSSFSITFIFSSHFKAYLFIIALISLTHTLRCNFSFPTLSILILPYIPYRHLIFIPYSLFGCCILNPKDNTPYVIVGIITLIYKSLFPSRRTLYLRWIIIENHLLWRCNTLHVHNINLLYSTKNLKFSLLHIILSYFTRHWSCCAVLFDESSFLTNPSLLSQSLSFTPAPLLLRYSDLTTESLYILNGMETSRILALHYFSLQNSFSRYQSPWHKQCLSRSLYVNKHLSS